MLNDISPISLLFYRWLVALIFLTPFSIRSFIFEINIIRSKIHILFVMAISGATLFNFFVYTALQHTSSTNVSIIISIFPLLVLFLGVLIDKQKLKKPQIYSILCSFIGLLIIVSKGGILSKGYQIYLAISVILLR
ncbi:MAG: DMT family transporter [Candidatus Rickettsia vulgarisii]